MKKELIGSIDLKDTLKNPVSVIVEYFLTETEEWEEGYDAERKFGIEVVKKETLNEVTYREIKSVSNMKDNKEEVKELLNMLCKNSVTPVCVADVLEDMFAMN